MSTIKKITSSRALYIVLACILSVILWMYVASYANTDMERELTGLEVDYIGGDDILRDRKLLVTEKDQQSVSLTLLGKRNVVSAINKDDVLVSVDLTDIRSSGVYEKVYTVTLPEGVKEDAVLIVKRSPEFVTVNIDKLMTKDVEVRGDFKGSVEEGYMQEPITYEPATVQVSGPEEIVSHISCAHVVLDRENLDRTVTVSIRGLETKHLIATNITFINVSEGYEPKAITQYKEIVIRGPAEIVALVDYRNVQLVADLSEIGSAVGRYSVPTSVYITGYSEVGVVEGNYNVVVSLEVKAEEPEPPPETEPSQESGEETGGEEEAS